MILSGLPDAARPAIRRNSLREQIAEALREEMMAGRLPAGRNFTVKEIADLYGVSATPAREAMVDLAAQGLLRAEHHRGFTVPNFSWADFLEIFEARTLLTDAAVHHLRHRLAEHDGGRLPSLRRRADAAVRASRAGQLDVLVGCDLRFWQEMTALLLNERISGYLGWLRVQSWMFAAPYLREADDLGGVCWDRHHELVDHIEAQDAIGAHRLVSQYNLFTVELLARLVGEPLESVAVLPMLRAAAASGPLDGPLASSPVEVGLGRVPLPRDVPPGPAFPEPTLPQRAFVEPTGSGNEEPATGR